MKTLSLIILTLSNFVLANDVDLYGVERLPSIREAKLVVINGPRFAAVQPRAKIEFIHASCSKMNFKAVVTKSDSLNFVKVKFSDSSADCRAIPRDRTYSLQVTSDYSFRQKYVVLNPISFK